MKTLRKSVLVGAAGLAMAATAVVTATPAQAASTAGGCTTSIRINAARFNEATSLCTQGSGTYQVAVQFPVFSLSSSFAPSTGPIVQVGQPSTIVYGLGNGQPVRVFGALTQILT